MVGGLKMQSTDPETELISASNLSTIVPYASDVDLRQIIKTEHTGDGGPLTDVRERQLLYYGRPQTKHVQSSVSFHATVNLSAPETSSLRRDNEGYLESQVPAGINLLEPLQGDPTMAHVKPYLSATRVSRVVPVTRPPAKPSRRLESGLSRTFRTVSATNFRVRYARLHTHLPAPSVNASLDFEVTPLAGCDVELQGLSLSLEEGDVSPLVEPSHGSLPLAILEVVMRLKAMVSDECSPLITVRWRTSVDFSIASRPAGSVSPRAQLGADETAFASLMANDPDALEDSETEIQADHSDNQADENSARAAMHSSEEAQWSGMTITISGPPKVCVGEVFLWRVFIVNRSRASKELALMVMPRRRRLTKAIGPQTLWTDDSSTLAEAVLDQPTLHQTQKATVMDPAEVICLTTDVRLRPLAPSACHELDLQLVALATGALKVEALRVVDLISADEVDIVELPTIFCKGSGNAGQP
ncbi:MAG: hypothetical protein M1815_004585 [Lichina confinis]|nr:MAG: hypothetical protein M1815_004585 [Lichina confinis]